MRVRRPALEVRAAQEVHEVAGRLAVGKIRAQGGGIVHIPVNGRTGAVVRAGVACCRRSRRGRFGRCRAQPAAREAGAGARETFTVAIRRSRPR
jgi:hypothetical protein